LSDPGLPRCPDQAAPLLSDDIGRVSLLSGELVGAVARFAQITKVIADCLT
jgi:hypothetical protein